MIDIERKKFSVGYPADDIWRAINTPLTGEVGKRVNPYVDIDYEDLSDEGLVQPGTLIVYRPLKEKLGPVLAEKLGPMMGPAITEKIPEDISMRVEQQSDTQRVRLDSLESDKHQGAIISEVEETADNAGLLVIEGTIMLGGLYSMIEDTIGPYAKRGIEAHSMRMLENLPAILAQAQ